MFSDLGKVETSVDRAAREMVTAIVGGRLLSGGRLPPERELADTFGINRGTLRSALHRLGAWGLIQARHGSGHKILDFRRHAGPAILSVWLSGVTSLKKREQIFIDLLEIRRALARVVVARLNHMPPEKLNSIEETILEFSKAVEEGSDENQLAVLDMKVIGSIVDASGSLVFRLFLNPITEVIESFEGLRKALYRNPAENVMAYQELLKAIRSGGSNLGELVDALLASRDQETMRVWKENAERGAST